MYLYSDGAASNNDQWKLYGENGGSFKIDSHATGSWQNEFTLTNEGNATFAGTITSTGNTFSMTNANPNHSCTTNNATLYVGYHLHAPSSNDTSIYQLGASYNSTGPVSYTHLTLPTKA